MQVILLGHIALQEYNLDKVAEYRSQVETARLGVPFFVKDAAAFQRSHPKGGRER